MVRKRENIQWAAVVWMKMPCWCQRRMGRLVRDDRKTTLTQITTRYNQGMQNTISERTTHRTLKQMDYSSRRPHRVPLLSAKKKKRRNSHRLTKMWWNGRFTSWMFSRQICSNCVILSCQYGPKSLRHVSNTLLNLCHEELRQFWRQKGVQPGTSKV